MTGVATFILLADIGNQRLRALHFDFEGGDQRVSYAARVAEESDGCFIVKYANGFAVVAGVRPTEKGALASSAR